ncbi:Ncs2p KNAG_0I02120 [Huiozyma naganishii CBS 8797]|uniref:Cytoplasmic tRNA 2-thiolation protein 2 n=1 Tax=Huiozyma naganishii (strain ATCC MYA-139 / BCRC 22969 / CBS 8797 / KCTC 17520 / NBRC 10181 / NCYC 3082 / Yp74L-3) TaxID=1071383 RepID=J7S2G4_HUIN7|nr:hypothetical protein KNAG_0I02120 [Kazachstania naganishii CBS 8797]CCK71997.1 hypothetical protein KNAG_0I02120 [Kazachstania naganishii CBS 8797]
MTAMKLCARCKSERATVESRKEPFCSECFTKFVSLKQRKRMMGDDYYRDCFKVSYGPNNGEDSKTLALLVFDFDSSSIVALDVICQVLREQKRQHRGKTGFRVNALAVVENATELAERNKMWSSLKKSERYSDGVLDDVELYLLDVNQFFETSELKQIVLHNEDFIAMCSDANESNYTLDGFLNLCPNRNTREEFSTYIKRSMIKKFAYQKDAKVIIWGYSMTKLADEILGLVVKGKGADVSQLLNNECFDADFNNEFKNLHPLKDILQAELDAFCLVTGLDQYLLKCELYSTLILDEHGSKEDSKKNVNSMIVRNMTMNELISKYFEDLDNEYSNIVATVLRTGDKLESPVRLLDGNAPKKCTLCDQVIYTDPSSWLRSIAVTKGQPVTTEEEQKNYDLWKDSKVGEETTDYLDLRNRVWKEKDETPLCYGCIISLNGIKQKNVIWPKNDDEELQSILADYEL